MPIAVGWAGAAAPAGTAGIITTGLMLTVRIRVRHTFSIGPDRVRTSTGRDHVRTRAGPDRVRLMLHAPAAADITGRAAEV